MRGWLVDGGTGLCSAPGIYVESHRLFKLLVSLPPSSAVYGTVLRELGRKQLVFELRNILISGRGDRNLTRPHPTPGLG